MGLIEKIQKDFNLPQEALDILLRLMATAIPYIDDARDYTHDEREVQKDTVNWGKWVGKIEHQKNLPICVAQSCEVIARVHTNRNRGFDRHTPDKQADYDAKGFYDLIKQGDKLPYMAGTAPRNGMKWLKKEGIIEVKPFDGAVFRIDKYWKCRNLKDTKNALLATGPVSACFKCYYSLFRCRGLIEKPKTKEPVFGYHQMALTGVTKDSFLGVGSWGEVWGSCGIFQLPFELYDDYITEAWCGE